MCAKFLSNQQRKAKRELAELRQLKEQVSRLKQPDPKILAAIDAEIKARE